MSGGGPQPGYNPAAVGALNSPSATSTKPMFGISGPPPLGSSLQAAAPLSKPIGGNLFGNFEKQGGFKHKLKIRMDGNMQDLAADVRTAGHGEIYGSSDGSGGGSYTGEAVSAVQPIIVAGGEMRGSMPESMLTGVGAIQPAATPSVGRDDGMGMGM